MKRSIKDTDLLLVREELLQAKTVLEGFLSDERNLRAVCRAADLCIECLNHHGKILSFGNGGSHCDAMHFCEELMARFRRDRRPLAAITVTDPSYVSCVSNDLGAEHVFSRFVEGLGKRGDILLAISTSGNSANILSAVRVAQAQGMKTILLCGPPSNRIGPHADLVIPVHHDGYSDRIQEVHIKILHVLVFLIEKKLFLEETSTS